MYDSNYPSNKKRSNNIDDTTYLPTAERSPYQEPSSFLNRTPNRSILFPQQKDRLSQTRRSIDQIIQQVSAKKSLNQQALEEVRNVNQEIASSFSSYNPVKSSKHQQRNRTAEHYRADSGDIVVTSQFEWRPQASEEDLKRSQRESVVSQENLDLRAKLNEEIKKNNELMKHAKDLQAENVTLKSSRNLGNSHFSTNYNSLIEENRYLRSQLAQSQQGLNGSIDILEELRRLKEENSHLRKQTLNLLNEKSSY